MIFSTRKQAAMLLVASILSASTIFFHFIEGWGWFDSFYFSVVTMSTVGYGTIVPVTILGKIGVIVLIFSGVGALAALVQIIAMDSIEKHTEKAMKKELEEFEKEIRTDIQDAKE
jgi:voltage-gated potassium channel